jgi:F-type H+-transporting ATPase subunit b
MALMDWFTVIAQIVNFLILVVALKYLLYDRILGAMDRRERRIASRLEEAQSKEDEAQQLISEYRKKQKELESKQDRILEQAHEDAEEKRKELLQEAKEDVKRLKREWKADLEKEKVSFDKDLQRALSKEAFLIASSALKEVADRELEEQVIRRFLDKIDDIGEDQREEIKNAAEDSGSEILVQTAFDPDDDQKEMIRKKLRDAFGVESDADFERSEEIFCGVTLKVNSRRIRWSVDDYLESSQRRVIDLINSESSVQGSESQEKDERKSG